MKKGLKAKVLLSDGVSRLNCLVSTKMHEAILKQGLRLRNFDIWMVNVAKQQITEVKGTTVMVLKSVPQVYGKHLEKQIGNPLDYSKNRRESSFRLATDDQLRIPSACNDEVRDLIEHMTLREATLNEKAHSCPRQASELPNHAYMPIKALNQFSLDWLIKVRVV